MNTTHERRNKWRSTTEITIGLLKKLEICHVSLGYMAAEWSHTAPPGRGCASWNYRSCSSTARRTQASWASEPSQ